LSDIPFPHTGKYHKKEENMRFSIVFIFLFFFPLFSQQYVIQWMEIPGDTGYDYGSAVEVDNKGNVYVVGYFMGIADYDLMFLKYDSSGTLYWRDTLDNGANDTYPDIAMDTAGNIYIGFLSFINGDWDCAVARYDTSGNLIWEDTLDLGSDEYFEGIAVDNQGGVYIAGYRDNGTDNDILMVKYDYSGNIVWIDTLGDVNDERAYDVATGPDGNIYFAGKLTIGTVTNSIVVKCSSDGNILRIDTLNMGYGDRVYGIKVDAQGNVCFTGRVYIGGDWDGFVVVCDSAGNILWEDTLEWGSDDFGEDIAVDRHGNVYVTGYSYIGDDYDWVVVKYDPSGNPVWMDTLDQEGNGEAQGIAVDAGNHLYITGYFYSDISADYNCLTVKYSPYRDAGIISVLSPDTLYTESEYIPEILVKNHSYLDTLTFDIVSHIDSSGIPLYTDTQTIYTLLPGSTTTVDFTPWSVISRPVDVKMWFRIMISDMVDENDTISRTLYLIDTIPPVIDSAVAFDGDNPLPGVDDDDYVILYFSEPTNRPDLDETNIDSVLSLSGGHSWTDGFGVVRGCYWNSENTQLLISLTTNISPPTITVGDTIKPDGNVLKDLSGNPCFSPVVLKGSFEPSHTMKKEKFFLEVAPVNKGGILLRYSAERASRLCIYRADGRLVREINQKEGDHTEKIDNLPPGLYFLRLEQGGMVIRKKTVVID